MELVAADIIWIYLIGLFLLLLLDTFWMGVLAQEFYQKEMKPIMRRRPSMPAIFVSYLILAGLFTYFVIVPSIEAQEYSQAVINGASLGFGVFAFYSLSALALVDNWSRRLAVREIIWGTVAAVILSGGTYLIFDLLLL